VIGKRTFGVSKAEAMDHVFGYVVINDVTSRELQKRHNQWVIGKGIDTFCPMGPWIATADEVGDPTKLELVTEINGEERQQRPCQRSDLRHPDPDRDADPTMTLLPGDIIATGTPVGVGIGFTPPKYLVKGGDRDARLDHRAWRSRKPDRLTAGPATCEPAVAAKPMALRSLRGRP
jgi:2-keto-4-pentenoate hydratase/2-oxohepta-3-ene-1,7-dioic acid hydratase in catechol pathway